MERTARTLLRAAKVERERQDLAFHRYREIVKAGGL